MMISSFKSVEGIRLVYKFKKINVLREYYERWQGSLVNGCDKRFKYSMFSDYGGLPIKVLDDKKLLNIWNR